MKSSFVRLVTAALCLLVSNSTFGDQKKKKRVKLPVENPTHFLHGIINYGRTESGMVAPSFLADPLHGVSATKPADKPLLRRDGASSPAVAVPDESEAVGSPAEAEADGAEAVGAPSEEPSPSVGASDEPAEEMAREPAEEDPKLLRSPIRTITGTAKKAIPKPKPASKKRTAPAAPSAPSPSNPGPSTDASIEEPVIDKSVIIVEDTPSPFTFSLDGGYQSRYYFMGLNQIDAATNDFFDVDGDETSMGYAGAGVNFKGLGIGFKYIRGTQSIEPRYSGFRSLGGVFGDELRFAYANPRLEVTEENVIRKANEKLSEGGTLTEALLESFRGDNEGYEEWVFDVNYSLDILPNGGLNLTAGYQALVFPEDSFWNTNRQDHVHVTAKNSTFRFLQPSISYHHLDQDTPSAGQELDTLELVYNDGFGNFTDLKITEFSNTNQPGAKILTGDIIVLQADGHMPWSQHGSPFDVVYYFQMGFDDGYNGPEGNDFAQDWWQTGVALPIYNKWMPNLVITPNWHYNYRFDTEDDENFWGVNAQFQF